MMKTAKCLRIKTGLLHTGAIWAVVLAAWSTLLIQCSNRPLEEAPKSAAAPTQTIVRDGITLERFATPEQQLQYTRTWFANPREKQAALELLIELFPEARTIRAEAELELAYLTLGGDYRFADSAACMRALHKYRHIVSEYADLRSVCAKAHWYMGWIYADLLEKPRKAIEHYQIIVDHYPDAILNLKPPVPWVGMVLPQAIERPMAVYEYPAYKWRSIALLEIIRNSEKEEEKWNAFEKLWLKDRNSLTTGYAIRELINSSPSLARRVASRASSQLEAQLLSQPMAEDVRIGLQSLKVKGDLEKQ